MLVRIPVIRCIIAGNILKFQGKCRIFLHAPKGRFDLIPPVPLPDMDVPMPPKPWMARGGLLLNKRRGVHKA
ncbi:MAG: hypothetical protein A2W19_17065 [Spirochaetes bacterium RBG_16_49_21]|nr:MAG: hypothetical protein A2W19_17065 [Spirochaetes bacterium RBG_16_49_21]